MALLSSSQFFGSLPANELETLEQSAQVRAYPAGVTIFREGDPGDGLCVILEGTVQISCLLTPNERRMLTRLGVGDYFGEIAVLDGLPRSATAAAETDVRLCYLSSAAVVSLLERSPQLGMTMVRKFSRRMREFHQLYVQAERLALVGRFARSIVHDLRNPLSTIGLSADTAFLPSATPEQKVSARNRIRRQLDRLANMANELLEFTRGDDAPALMKVNYAEFIQQVVDELRSDVTARSAQLELAGPPPAVSLPMDPRRLAHVFQNLVNNACDAMPDGGTVTLAFRLGDQELETDVQDTGTGIAPEIQPRLFEPFATFGKPSGTGLGLSICRRIIEDHRGTISARNRPEGGAVFTFTLPLESRASSPHAPLPTG